MEQHLHPILDHIIAHHATIVAHHQAVVAHIHTVVSHLLHHTTSVAH